MKLNKALEVFLQDMNKRELSRSHRKNTVRRVNMVCELWIDQDLEELDRADLTNRIQDLEEIYAEASVAGLVQVAKAFFKFCKEKGWIDANIADHLRPRSYRAKSTKAAPEEVVAKLSEAIPGFVAQRDDHPRDVRDGLIVCLSLQSGSRLSGITNLRRSDMISALKRPYRTGNGRVSYHVSTKSKGRMVQVLFYSETEELFHLWEKVRPYFSNEPDRVFISLKDGKALRSGSVSNAFNRICSYAEVPITRSHAIRHRNVTDLLRAGADAKVAAAYAGHSSEAVTIAHYRHLVENEVDNAMAKVLDQRQDESVFQDQMQDLFDIGREGEG